MEKYHVYTKSNCPYCDTIKKALTSYKEKGLLDVSYESVEDKDDRIRLYDEWGLIGNKRTFPQIFLEDSSGRLRLGDCTETLPMLTGLYGPIVSGDKQ